VSSIKRGGGGSTKEHVKTKIQKARGAFITLKNIWKTGKIKIRIFNPNVKSVLMYGSESWRERELARNYRCSLTGAYAQFLNYTGLIKP
jgi:hypothetical protein